MKRTWSGGVAVLLVLQPAITQAQTSRPSCTDAAPAALTDSGDSDAATGDAGPNGPVDPTDAACPPTSPPVVDGGVAPPSVSPPGDGSAATGPIYKGDPRLLDPMLADPSPFVEPTYAPREEDPAQTEPSPAARVDAPDDIDHTQACGCRFAGHEQPATPALLAPLLGLLWFARRRARLRSLSR